MGTTDFYVAEGEPLPPENTRFATWDPSAFDTGRHGATFTATPPPIAPTRWQRLVAGARVHIAQARASEMQIRVADFWLCMIAAATVGAISLIATLEIFG